MFRQAVVKLTLWYSGLFFILFWLLSYGMYWYFAQSFGERFLEEVNRTAREQTIDLTPFDKGELLVDRANDVALQHVRDVLVFTNTILLVVIPSAAFVLARQTLRPIQEVMVRQRQFVTDASHELRTPLAVATSEIEVALHRERSVSFYRRTLAELKDEMNRLADLVKNLLMLAQQTDAHRKMDWQKVDVVDAVSQAMARVVQPYNQKGVHYEIVYPEKMVTVKGNLSMLTQMLTNLLDNALKYTPRNGKVTVAVKQNRNRVIIEIADTGVGITKEDLLHMFDRFYRGAEHRSQVKGYGLGMAIVKGVVDLHHGTIRVMSEVGKGTKVMVQLPLVRA